MKKLSLSVFALLIVYGLNAQIFIAKDSVILDSTSSVESRIVDFDSDGILEYFFVRSDSTKMGCTPYIMYLDTLGSPIENATDTLKIHGYDGSHFDFADLNNDSRPDLIFNQNIGQSRARLFYNGDTTSILIDSLGSDQFYSNNLDRDGRKEILIKDSLQVLKIKKSIDSTWLNWVTHFTVDNVAFWSLVDFGPKGEKRLLVSTVKDSTFLLEIMPDTIIRTATTLNLSNSILLQEVDWNNDGHSELLSLNADSVQMNFQIVYKDTILSITNLELLDQPKVFVADLNSDGLVDIHLVGQQGSSYIQKVFLHTLDGVVLIEDDVYDHPIVVAFGDLDFDGDLDKYESHLIDNHIIIHFNNESSVSNLPPNKVNRFYQFALQGGLALAWEGVDDDHTPQKAITYDLFVGNSLSDASRYSGNFIPSNSYRYLPSGGTNGSRLEFSLRKLDPANYYFGIQSVDNSFHYLSGRCNGGGIGSADICGNIACGEQEVCENLLFETKNVCAGDSTILSFDTPKALFSSANGFMGVRDEFRFLLTETDTIYLEFSGCENLSGYVINVIFDQEIFAAQDIWSCDGAILSFNGRGVDSISWVSQLNGLLSNELSIQYEVLAEDLLITESYVGKCIMIDSLEIHWSSPQAIDISESITLIKGETASLNLPVEYDYNWTPSNGIEDPLSNQPIIVTRESVDYLLTVMDSLGCELSIPVKVTIVDKGWIPDLFTPNGDGNNDLLKIYGLENVSSFQFIIYSRSGEVVYNTESIHEITTRGWDGKKDELDLPIGVYTWKVVGKLDNDAAVNLNGSSTGKVFLIR